jgi:hypothetical protein
MTHATGALRRQQLGTTAVALHMLSDLSQMVAHWQLQNSVSHLFASRAASSHTMTTNSATDGMLKMESEQWGRSSETGPRITHAWVATYWGLLFELAAESVLTCLLFASSLPPLWTKPSILQ